MMRVPGPTAGGGRLIATGLTVLLSWALGATAAPDGTARGEIGFLLTRLQTSGCAFFRNGDWYDAASARRHVERKYAWLVKRDLVSSAEQFVERAAAKSSRSGERYLVRCPDEPAVPSAVWLSKELRKHREDPGGQD